MIYAYNKKNVPLAQELRKRMTNEEKHLWYDFLKNLPITVNRQKNIGDYIVDFYIAKNRIVIEVDGAQHKLPHGQLADQQRDAELRALGITVLRYTNEDINWNFAMVCESILDHLGLCAGDLKQNF